MHLINNMVSITIEGRVISKKNSRRNFGHTSLPSVAFEKFKAEALRQIGKQVKGATITTPVRVTLLFKLKGKIQSDIDNMTTSIFDILQDAAVIENDSLVKSLYVEKQGGFKDFCTFICIEHYTQS